MNQQQPQAQSAQAQPSPSLQEAPAVITGKDLNYINDMMAWNLTAAKKAHFYAQHCQDQEIKQAIDAAGQMHQRHYDQLLNVLNQPKQPPTYQ